MNKSNFDVYLEQQLQSSEFAKRFRRAGAAWDVAIRSQEQTQSPCCQEAPSATKDKKRRPFNP